MKRLREVTDGPEACVAILANRSDGIIINPDQSSNLTLWVGIYNIREENMGS